MLYYNGIGWATCTSVINVANTVAYTLPNSNTFSSYAGGEFVVQGGAISQQAIIQVGGFIGKVIRQNADYATFAIPPLIVPQITTLYPSLAQSQKIVGDKIISDGGNNPSASFDGLHSTYYSSYNPICYIGIDVGSNKVANIDRIKYFPDY